MIHHKLNTKARCGKIWTKTLQQLKAMPDSTVCLYFDNKWHLTYLKNAISMTSAGFSTDNLGGPRLQMWAGFASPMFYYTLLVMSIWSKYNRRQPNKAKGIKVLDLRPDIFKKRCGNFLLFIIHYYIGLGLLQLDSQHVIYGGIHTLTRSIGGI